MDLSISKKLTIITKDTKIFNAVGQYPETLQIFLDLGFVQMVNPVMRNATGHTASIEMAIKCIMLIWINFSKPLTMRSVQKINSSGTFFDNRKEFIHEKTLQNLSHVIFHTFSSRSDDTL